MTSFMSRDEYLRAIYDYDSSYVSVLAAEKEKGEALQYASEEFRADKEVVLAAVKEYGRALQYASKELKKDPDVLEAARSHIVD